MAPTFEDFIQSPQFTFFVGKERKPIVVHAAAIAATSQHLDALVNGGMQESETRCARMKDVSVDDFIRFCEYAYRGDYTIPRWEELLPEPSSQNNKNDDLADDNSPKNLILQNCESPRNRAANHNCAPVLLAHARLYCFAHLRLIMSLKSLTLQKLQKTLMSFDLHKNGVGDIIELARYTYSNPDLPDRSGDETTDDLRKLVVEYIVCEIDTIGKCDDFIKYMEEGGEFAGDFWRIARNQMA